MGTGDRVGRGVAVLLPFLPAAAGLFLLAIPSPAPAEPAILTDRLPDSPLACPLSGGEQRLTDALSGRPLVIYLTDAGKGYANPLGRAVSQCQIEYGPWLTWVGVLVGEASREEFEKLRRQSSISLDLCFQDPEGQWWRSLRAGPLPAAVLVNEDGFVVGRFSGDDGGGFLDLYAAAERMARAATIKGRAVQDFRLTEAGSGRRLSLLDVSEKDYTFLFFLQTSCGDCLRELRVLERVRDRYPDRVGLVTVFHDHPEGEQISKHLESWSVDPDYILADPDLAYAGSYFFDSVPVLLVVGPDGSIAFSRKGYRSRDALALAAALDGIVFNPSPPEGRSPFREARQVSSDAATYLDEGNAGMALLYWERALELFPGAGTLHLHIAEAYQLLGKKREAVREYARYLSSGAGSHYDLSDIRIRLREAAFEGP